MKLMSPEWGTGIMKKLTEIPNPKQNGKIASSEVVQNKEVSLRLQVRREFEKSEDRGEPESEQLKNGNWLDRIFRK